MGQTTSEPTSLGELMGQTIWQPINLGELKGQTTSHLTFWRSHGLDYFTDQILRELKDQTTSQPTSLGQLI